MGIARIPALICAILVLASGTAADTGIPGWGKATWGMTHSAVKKHYQLKTWEPGRTPTCKSKQKVRIWGRDFSVAFYFDARSASGKLYKVTLVHFNHKKKDADWMHAIKDMLVQKYGNPDTFETQETMKTSFWKQSDGQLKFTTLTGQTVMCAMEYMAVSTEKTKL